MNIGHLRLTMKRLVITLYIIATLGMIFPTLPTLAQPVQVPHENPATATGSLDKSALMLSYSGIINLATSRQYQDAQDLLNELRLADIPDGLRYITNHYHNTCQQLINTLDNMESLLDESSTLLAHNQIHEAKQTLDNAEADIQNANFLLEDIRAATETLSNELGVFASPAASPIRQAHARLEESTERLGQTVDRLHDLQHSQTEIYIQMTALIPTELSLSIMPASVFVGDSLEVSGRLSGDGKPLARKNLAITLDNKKIATNTTTGIDGSYSTSITIPCQHADTMTLTAVYEPSGDDTEKYLASQSPPVTINTMFYSTLLEVSAPEILHPGLPFTISGRVSTTSGNTERNVRVLLDDIQLAEKTVPSQFSLKVISPEQAVTGQHNLTVSVIPQGRYAGTASIRTVHISSLPIHIDAQTPRLIVLPGTIEISGRAYHALGPIQNGKVTINFKDSSSTVRTSPDGTFTVSVKTPLDLSPVERPELTVTATPAETWYATTQVKQRFFIINPFSMELIILALLAMWILVDIGCGIRRRGEADILQPETTELPIINPAPIPKPRLTGIKGRILSAYRSGLETVEKIIGVGMAPNITMREFLKMATLLLPGAIKQFAELTTIAEITLYSARSPREDTAIRAEQLTDNIEGELHSGTP